MFRLHSYKTHSKYTDYTFLEVAKKKGFVYPNPCTYALFNAVVVTSVSVFTPLI